MDLCLRGSQINLAARQKPKPKHSSQTQLYPGIVAARPRSAPFFCKRSRASFPGRPQSAEPKCGPRCASVCGQYCRDSYCARQGLGRNPKRYQSVSSSSLLKLLLDEPIKRSWLCRGRSSPDNQSDLSSARKSSPARYSLNKRTRTESMGGSSVEGDQTRKTNLAGSSANEGRRLTMSASLNRMSSASSLSSLNRDKSHHSTSASVSSRSHDYWHSSSTSTKPDLPGRVSFSKPNAGIHNDLDFSDCDNDKQETNAPASTKQTEVKSAEEADSISAPGPLTLPKFNYNTKTEANANANACANEVAAKKSVHFGAASNGETILAETFEYPKCPSENCSCSTRSSSTASVQDGLDMKCACDSPTCKYTNEVSRVPVSNLEQSELVPEKINEKKGDLSEELKVIREYKNVVGDQVENSIVKNVLQEQNDASPPNNRIEVPQYLEKFASPVKRDVNLEKQNNLSESTKQTLTHKTGVKINLVPPKGDGLAQENNFEENLKLQPAFSTTSDSVINNYLKVAASAAMTKKKENNRGEGEGSAHSVGSGRRGKATNSRGFAVVKDRANYAMMKKATSFGYSRENSDFDYDTFNLDNVDTWMSMQKRKPMAKHSSLDDELEKLTKATEDEKQGENKDKEEGEGKVETVEYKGQGEEGRGEGEEGAGGEGEEAEDQEDTSSIASSKSNSSTMEDSTYNEIVSVIKEIEEDKKKDNYAERAASELELKIGTPSEPGTAQATATNSKEASPDKYTDILNYLDNVEDSCERTLMETRRSMPDSNRTEVEFVVEPDIAEDVPKLPDLLMLPNHQLARRIIALSLRANELANAVYLSKEHLKEIRSEKQKHLRAEKAHGANRLREQKKHYEAIVKRHQGFIEQLLKDKGSLCEKVAALTRRLESQNQAWEHKLETELTRVRETTMAGEKIRRERWVRENTKRIKELTVKGLEAEINRMNCEHQRQITELKQAHQQQLLDALEEARLKHEQIENNIRETVAQDRETIIEKERNAIRERFERQLEEERKSATEQREKLQEDFGRERERLHNELKAKDVDYQQRRQELQREKETELEQTVAELQEKMSKQEEKYQNRINTIEKQYEMDFEIWKKEYENSCKVMQAEKENIIRQHYRLERDRQIDAIVSRMDAEAQKNAEEYEQKLERLKEKYEKDLQAVENVEKSVREKFTDTRSKLAESDAQVRNQEAEIKRLQIELEHSKKMCNDLLLQHERLRDTLRHEVQLEMGNVKAERDNEIQKIHQRVQQAIEKKDATIEILQKENGGLRERCLKLEAIIRQQRKDYCVK